MKSAAEVAGIMGKSSFFRLASLVLLLSPLELLLFDFFFFFSGGKAS